VESAYTISSLSPTLSSFEDYLIYESDDIPTPQIDIPLPSSTSANPNETLSVRYVLIQSSKRALIYPYLRIWKLIKKILVDVTKILFLGQRCVLKCLLQTHHIFEHTDTHYLLNKLYLDDYCMWIQTIEKEYSETRLKELGKECNKEKATLTKLDLGLDLEIPDNSLEQTENQCSFLANTSISSPPKQAPQLEEAEEKPLVTFRDLSISSTSNSTKPLIEVISSTETMT
jgi:hypothetical protein